jgi:DNA repair exonuclease SbcCD ATPase subunit
MILHALRVENWRCFTAPIVLQPSPAGVTLVCAPNGTGKSTLFEALRRGLLDGCRVMGRDVESLRPRGKDLAPAVTIEFAHGGARYRLHKRFLDQPTALLEHMEGARYVSLASGDAADKRVREILQCSPPSRGLSQPQHWGLAQILWAPQGTLALPELSRDVVAHIRQSLGAQVTGEGGRALEERVEKAYAQIFTPQGRYRTGKEAPPVVVLEGRLLQERENRIAAAQRLADYEASAERVVRLARAREEHVRRHAALSAELAEARQRVERYSTLVSAKTRTQAELDAAESRRSEIVRRVEAIARVRRDRVEAEAEHARLTGEEATLAQQLAACEARAHVTRTRLEALRATAASLDAARVVGEHARAYARASTERTRAAEVLRALRDAEGVLEDRRRTLAALNAPDAAAVRAIRAALKARDEAALRLDACAITVEIAPEADGTLEVITDGVAEARALVVHHPVAVSGAPEVEFRLPGVARVKARGPAQNAAALREHLARAEAEVRRLTEPFGTSEGGALEELHDRAMRIERELADADARRAALLNGRTAEQIDRDRTAAETRVQEIEALHPEWISQPPDPDALAAEWTAQNRALTQERTRTEQELSRGEEERDRLRRDHGAIREALSAITARTESYAAEETRLLDDGLSNAERDEECKKREKEWSDARRALKQVEEELEAFREDPRRTAQRLEEQIQKCAEDERRAFEEHNKEEGRLTLLGGEGPYSILCKIDEEIAALESDIHRETRRSEAIRLLRDTIARCRTDALNAVSQPAETLASEILSRIQGERLAGVVLSTGFEPRVRHTSAGKDPVDMDSLSGGEQEQVHFAVRLALAEVLARDERQLVVLDDVLTATDDTRLEGILHVLQDRSEQLQIVILTCHPKRYDRLAAALRIDLEAEIAREADTVLAAEAPANGRERHRD